MEFDPEKLKIYKSDVKKIFFIYIVSKRFIPYNKGRKVLNLFKVGSSSNDFGRLSFFKTTLIDFKIHRIYIHSGNLGTRMEQMLFREIKYNFKPTTARLEFKNGKESEWFNIKKEKDFLKFCDDIIERIIFPNYDKYLKFSVNDIETITNTNFTEDMTPTQAERAAEISIRRSEDDFKKLDASKKKRLQSANDPPKSKL